MLREPYQYSTADPGQLQSIRCLLNFLKNIHKSSLSCAAINRQQKHEQAPHFLEFTFTLVQSQAFDNTTMRFQSCQTIRATAKFVLLTPFEQDLENYIIGAPSMTDNITTRIEILLRIRDQLLFILNDLAAAERAKPYSILVRARKGQWLIRVSRLKSYWDELPPLPPGGEEYFSVSPARSSQTSGYLAAYGDSCRGS